MVKENEVRGSGGWWGALGVRREGCGYVLVQAGERCTFCVSRVFFRTRHATGSASLPVDCRTIGARKSEFLVLGGVCCPGVGEGAPDGPNF